MTEASKTVAESYRRPARKPSEGPQARRQLRKISVCRSSSAEAAKTQSVLSARRNLGCHRARPRGKALPRAKLRIDPRPPGARDALAPAPGEPMPEARPARQILQSGCGWQKGRTALQYSAVRGANRASR